jgi:type IV pilus assembly protein PilE
VTDAARHDRNLKRRQPASGRGGFTLIELLITLAVVAILSAIAWPGYAAIMHRAQRNDARLALLRIQQLQEMHYANHLRYAAKFGSASDEETLVTSGRSDGGHYQLSLTVAEDAQRYTATARASADGSQRRDLSCRQLAVDESGRRRSADSHGVWTEQDEHRCWS